MKSQQELKMVMKELMKKFDKEELMREGSLPNKGEEIITHFLKKKPIKTAVEIGTFNGVSTALLARFAEKVITIDIKDRPLKHKIWDYLKLKNIKSYIVKGNEEKKKILDNLEFDFAFIDGDHSNAQPDLELCKKCKRILFHDYDHRSVYDTVNSLPKEELEVKDIFAYWEKGEKMKMKQCPNKECSWYVASLPIDLETINCFNNCPFCGKELIEDFKDSKKGAGV